ncbi:hypothetical protein DIPPA_08014 [Diplonema papillatum]|nr:hypothetical protein DIPPA_08014 [Diplonema papillatum]
MSIFAKLVEQPGIGGVRTFMNLGGEDGHEGFSFGTRRVGISSYRLTARYFNEINQVNINPFDWHHYAATYNGSTAKLYIDEEEVASKDVALDLVESSRYSTMTIGEAHNGQTESGRSGVWLFDEAVFGRGVLDFDVMQPPCNPLVPAAPPA